MKDNLFNPSTEQTIVERIQRLSPDTPRLWGKMTQSQVLCHMADPFRDVLNMRQTKPAVPALFRPLIRRMVLTDRDWKPNTPTLKVYLQAEGGGGTKPTDFYTDKATLLGFLTEFCSKDANYQYGPHPGMGSIDRQQHGFMMWKHLDHHLRQFGL